jgi:hypothetical protein
VRCRCALGTAPFSALFWPKSALFGALLVLAAKAK